VLYEVTHEQTLLHFHLKCFAIWELVCIEHIEHIEHLKQMVPGSTGGERPLG
jgi:hypothetical protein